MEQRFAAGGINALTSLISETLTSVGRGGRPGKGPWFLK